MQFLQSISGLVLFLQSFRAVHAIPISAGVPNTSLPLPIHVVHEFPKGTWVENIAVRPCGQLLTTISTAPELYQVDPQGIVAPVLVHTFPGALGLFGISELEDNVYYVIAGNLSFVTFHQTLGSSSVWRVDMRNFRAADPSSAAVTKVTDVTASGLLNGMTVLDKEDGTLLMSDSAYGLVWRLDTQTGEAVSIIDVPEMAPKNPQLPLGINGLHTREKDLYFTNSDLAILARIPILRDGTAAGAAVVLSTGSPADDFILDARRNAFIAQNAANNLAFVPAGGGAGTVLAGSLNSSDLAGPTAAAFGRTRLDRNSLYVTSTGGIAHYRTGNFTVGGRVNRIDIGVAEC